jgi:hypothetical protein
MREHYFPHCSWWRDQQKAFWKVVGEATGRKAGRCRHLLRYELCSIEECDQVVMDFQVASDVRKLPPKWMALSSGHRG